MTTMPKLIADRYEVGNAIGKGGMAEVYLGKDTRLDRRVAIKVLKNDLIEDKTQLTRFKKEAISAASLNHANIVAVYDSGEEKYTDGAGNEQTIMYIVMEYVQGQTLKDILKAKGKLSIKDTNRIIKGVLEGLQYADNVNLVHRDIKPANIMITREGTIKLMDFGIARALADSSVTDKEDGVVGTPQYISPEQAQGQVADMRSDLYSVGCVFFECVTGQAPFQGETPVSIAYQHVTAPHPKLSEFTPNVPKQYETIIENALAKDKIARYSNASEFLRDLSYAEQDRPVRAISGGEAGGFGAGSDVDPDATQVVGASAANGGQAFSFKDDEENDDEWYDEENDEEEAKKAKKKKIIIGSVIGAVVLIIIIAALLLNKKPVEEPIEDVVVPTITSTTTEDEACKKIEDIGLECEILNDSDSVLPKGIFSKQDPTGGSTVKTGSTVKVYYSSGPDVTAIPEVKDKTQEEVKKILESAGYKVGVTNTENSVDVKSNQVTRTEPASGATVKKGTTVNIYISNGQIDLPDLVGLTKAEAQTKLAERRLTASFEEKESDTAVPGTVMEQSPTAGNVVQLSVVRVYIAKEATVVLKDYTGFSFAAASAELISLGLQVKRVYSDDPKLSSTSVVKQDQPAGTLVKKGTLITLTTGPEKPSGN
ncbi:MAG: Stk1 family PASTA domain-containing Ser/Thr kinase [Bifidobacteriaceae bacterium]|jgi:serine/threonine-protein kinase|nr:Stk1 family PASTA domain-containing Ser/Thr kinase [Bifidobacteriaceae bacterium]